MRQRPDARPAFLLLAVFCWLASPVFVSAAPGPGAGGSSGGHGGGGGHAGSSGGRSGSYATTSVGHAPASAPAGTHYSAPAAAGGGHVRGGAYVSSGPAAGASGSLATFASSASGGVGYGSVSVHGPVSNAALSQLAAHGWTFAPSSGVRPAAQPVAVRPAAAVPVTRGVPIVVPPHNRPRPHPPFATTVIVSPGFGFAFAGGGCINNGFTTVCGIGGGFFPYWGLGYGYGWGYPAGYGYYGNSVAGYYGASEPYVSTADDLYPQNSGRMDIYGGYSANALTPPAEEDTTPAQPPTHIILKDGSAFAVTTYWVADGELYYRPVTGGLNHVPLDQIDLNATVAANSKNNVPFTLSERKP